MASVMSNSLVPPSTKSQRGEDVDDKGGSKPDNAGNALTVVINDDEDDEDEDDVIDSEQLEEYQEMVDQLGNFPDKVKINSLSMVAEDHAESKKSARAIYDCIRKLLVSSSISRDRKLPLVYVIDSILKNVKGNFIPIIEMDAKVWMPVVHGALMEEQRKKLKRVWNTWREFKIFSEDSWREMGRCFTISDAQLNASRLGDAKPGISRAADGTLQLTAMLRKEMQILLDEVQSTVENELDKVSLERLADIDPDLLAKIKKMAEDVINSGQSGVSGNAVSTNSHTPQTPSFFAETRSPDVIARSKEWEKLNLKHTDQSHDLIAKLQQYVRAGSSLNEVYSQEDAIQMTHILAAVSATAMHLTNALQSLKDLDSNKENKLTTGTKSSFGNRMDPSARRFLAVDKSLFTNEGVKKKNNIVIGVLYDMGLPFVSSSDGRRFATQLELSKHLDYLFKKSQLDKSMERTEERGWYVDGAIWTGESSAAELRDDAGVESTDKSRLATTEDDADPSTFTVPADESRDRCVICGINFKMFFDNDDGIYKYSNCREIEVLNDDAAENESESMLVHVTCWRGLGSPPLLTMDQALQETQY